MFGPRWKKVLRDLTGNKTRTLLVVLSISVGVFAVGVIVTSQFILTRDVTERFAAIDPHSARLVTNEPFDDELIQSVRRMPEIGDVEGCYTTNGRIRRIDANDWYQFSLNALDDYADVRIDKIWSERGAYPPREREILIERSAFDFIKAQIGDIVEIEMPSGRKRELVIAGVVRDLNSIPPIYSAPVVGYIDMHTLEWLGEPPAFNQLVIIVAGNCRDKTRIEQIAAKVRDDRIETTTRKVVQIDIPLSPGEPPLSFVLNAMLMILGVLSVMVLLPSGFLVINTIQALLRQQMRQIGIMKAIGARTTQIAAMYLVVVALFGLLALLLPLPLSAIGARGFSTYMAEILNLDVAAFSIPPEAVVIQIVIGLGVPLVAALYPILTGVRVTIREAITSRGISDFKFEISDRNETNPHARKIKSAIINLQSKIFPRPLLLSLRNMFRRKGRLVFTLAPLMLSGALFIAVFSVRASLLLSLDELSKFWKYDIAIDLQSPYPVERIDIEARAIPGVESTEFWHVASAVRVRADESESIAIPVYAPPATTQLIQPTIVEGHWLLPDDDNAIVLTTTLLQYEPGIKVGDEIVLKIQDRKSAWRVVGFAKGGMTAIPNTYVNYPAFGRVIHSPTRANGLRVVTTQHDSAFQLQTMRAIEEHFKRMGIRVSMTEASAELIERITGGMMVLVIFLLVLAILLAAVGALGLMGTMTLSVLERTREIGVMRAIGASNRAILQIVMVEAILIGGLSGLGAAILAYPISWALSYETGDLLFKTPLAFAFPPSGIVLWLGLVIVIAAIASYLPARNASRLTVREVLAYE